MLFTDAAWPRVWLTKRIAVEILNTHDLDRLLEAFGPTPKETGFI